MRGRGDCNVLSNLLFLGVNIKTFYMKIIVIVTARSNHYNYVIHAKKTDSSTNCNRIFLKSSLKLPFRSFKSKRTHQINPLKTSSSLSLSSLLFKIVFSWEGFSHLNSSHLKTSLILRNINVSSSTIFSSSSKTYCSAMFRIPRQLDTSK